MLIILLKSISGYRCHCVIADLGLEATCPLVPRRGAPGKKDSKPWAKADLDGSYSHPLRRFAWPHTVQDSCISPAMARSTATPTVSMARSRRQHYALDCIPSRLGMRHPLLGWDMTPVPATRLTLPAPGSPARGSDFWENCPCNAAWAFCTSPGIRSPNPSGRRTRPQRAISPCQCHRLWSTSLPQKPSPVTLPR